jgi:hypothetical protein
MVENAVTVSQVHGLSRLVVGEGQEVARVGTVRGPGTLNRASRNI